MTLRREHRYLTVSYLLRAHLNCRKHNAIKDKETDEVIKEIPSEKALKMLEKAWEIAGILVDEKR